MIKEKVTSQKFTLVDVQSVFYEIMNPKTGILEEKRYRNIDLAKEKAKETDGEVVKVTKSILETMEMELVR